MRTKHTLDSGVVDQDVQAAEVPLSEAANAGSLNLRRHVEVYILRRRPDTGGGLGACVVEHVGDDYLGALTRE
jgi:hypothetical protein